MRMCRHLPEPYRAFAMRSKTARSCRVVASGTLGRKWVGEPTGIGRHPRGWLDGPPQLNVAICSQNRALERPHAFLAMHKVVGSVDSCRLLLRGDRQRVPSRIMAASAMTTVVNGVVNQPRKRAGSGSTPRDMASEQRIMSSPTHVGRHRPPPVDDPRRRPHPRPRADRLIEHGAPTELLESRGSSPPATSTDLAPSQRRGG